MRLRSPLAIGIACLGLLLCLLTVMAEARPRPHRCGTLAAVVAPRGAVACVSQSAAGAFQGFVNALSATGYGIAFMGGWRAHGSCRGCDMHPRGLAIDINQVARNRVTRRLPAGVTALAAQYGIVHGAVWRHPDAGHFEIAGVHHYARRHHTRPPAARVALRAE